MEKNYKDRFKNKSEYQKGHSYQDWHWLASLGKSISKSSRQRLRLERSWLNIEGTLLLLCEIQKDILPLTTTDGRLEIYPV